MHDSEPVITKLDVDVYCVPTDAPEADGTLAWGSTTMVLVRVTAANRTGIGYSYTSRAAAPLIYDVLHPWILGRSAFDIGSCWQRMLMSVRNIGRPGLCATAIAAVDAALWDLKARLLNISLLDLFGAIRASIPIYGSGGFTSYDEKRLTGQLERWIAAGIRGVKMKLAGDQDLDRRRVGQVRVCIGDDPQLMVDANGAYDVKGALAFAERTREQNLAWFEEPVSSDDLAGLRFVRERVPAVTSVAAGEYGYDELYFRRMLQADAVDILQADATRCCGLSGFLRADTLAAAFNRPLSSHCAPALHLHACCAASAMLHMEYFHDHVRIERQLFDGVIEPHDGELRPDRSRPGNGLHLRESDAQRYRI